MNTIIEKYMVLVEKISNTTKSHRPFNTDVNIYRTEIHIIQIIGDRESTYVSEIARLIGITKATVSQIIKRLEGKGLVEKRLDAENNTRQKVVLTNKGQTAYTAHVEFHYREHAEMEQFLRSLPDEHKATLATFLDKAYDMCSDHL